MADFHLLTSGTTRNPIGSKAPPHTIVRDVGYVWTIMVTRNEEPFDLSDLDEEARLQDLEAYIVKHRLDGVWKLQIVAPLWDATWERNTEGDWLCIQAGRGYA